MKAFNLHGESIIRNIEKHVSLAIGHRYRIDRLISVIFDIISIDIGVDMKIFQTNGPGV